MKAFVVHIDTRASRTYLREAVTGLQAMGWEAVPFLGVEPSTFQDRASSYNTSIQTNSRLASFRNQGEATRLRTKMCCAVNHLLIAERCVALGEPVAFVEHDARCLGPPPTAAWDDVLIMNAAAGLDHIHAISGQHVYPTLTLLGRGPVLPWRPTHLRCHHVFKTGWYMPGTGAYAITPSGAAKILDHVAAHGLEQSDFMINTNVLTIQVHRPCLFTLVTNLRTSHGGAD